MIEQTKHKQAEEKISTTTLPPLAEDVLQLWRVDLASAADLLQRYTSCLTPEERGRAESRRAGQVREQFVFGRACLRILLGRVLGVGPLQVPITNGSHGKPETPALRGQSVSFNVAHSKGTILIALSRRGAVGVDIEHVNPATDLMEIALQSFTANEYMKLVSFTSAEQRQRAFYRCWTQKEAVVKADGRGLTLPLSSFEVPVGPANCAPVRISEPSGDPGRPYFVSDLLLGDDLAGAVALESPDDCINLLTFPLESYW